MKQSGLRLPDPNLLLVEMGRDSCTGGEYAKETVRPEMGETGQVSQEKVIGVMVVHE